VREVEVFGMGKGRLRPEFVERAESFSDRCLGVAEVLAEAKRFGRFVDQLAASGTSVGANLAEADQAMSTADFRKSLSIAMKELAETRFWLRLAVRRGWLRQDRTQSLFDELEELRLVVGSLLSKTKPNAPR
jgi:four helix bundle protein